MVGSNWGISWRWSLGITIFNFYLFHALYTSVLKSQWLLASQIFSWPSKIQKCLCFPLIPTVDTYGKISICARMRRSLWCRLSQETRFSSRNQQGRGISKTCQIVFTHMPEIVYPRKFSLKMWIRRDSLVYDPTDQHKWSVKSFITEN